MTGKELKIWMVQHEVSRAKLAAETKLTVTTITNNCKRMKISARIVESLERIENEQK